MYLPESQQINLSASDLILALTTSLVVFPVVFPFVFQDLFVRDSLKVPFYFGILGRCVALADNYVLSFSGGIISKKKLHYLLQTIGLVMSLEYTIPYLMDNCEEAKDREGFGSIFLFYTFLGEIAFYISSFLAYRIIYNGKQENDAQVNTIHGANPNLTHMSNPQLHVQPQVQLQAQPPSYIAYGQAPVPQHNLPQN